jgi:hypothetical protein
MRAYGVHIFCTVDVHELPLAYTNEIADLLNQVKDKLVFFGRDVIDEEIVNPVRPIFEDPYRRLSMSQIFSLCEQIREKYNLFQEEPFIVLLTNKENDEKWFSATDGRNIYINVRDLQTYTNDLSRYPIAFQILENIFQSICGIVYKENQIDPRLHKTATGCINDLCSEKRMIIQKIKSCKICADCKGLVVPNTMSEIDFVNFTKLLNSIKTPTIIKFKQTEGDEKLIVVDENGNLFINGTKVKIDYLPLSFYIFFLQQKKEIHVLDLKHNVKNIASIYQKIKHKGEYRYKLSKGNIEKIRQKVVSSDTIKKNPGFLKIVSSIKKALSLSVSADLLDFIHLKSNGSSAYSIEIDINKTDIHENYLLSK